jgi:hypothetical protein
MKQHEGREKRVNVQLFQVLLWVGVHNVIYYSDFGAHFSTLEFPEAMD